MKQYIITEEQLNRLQYRKKRNPFGIGHGSEYLPLAYYEIDDITAKVRSHPYNPHAEREKVLDRIMEFVDNADNNFKVEYGEGRFEFAITIHRLVDIIESLRQEGKVEK